MEDIEKETGEQRRDLSLRLEKLKPDKSTDKPIEEKDKLLKAIEISREAVIITSSDGEILYANDSMDKLFGYSKGELVGKYPSIFNAGPAPEATTKQIMNAVEKQDFWEGEIHNKRKDGTEFISYVRISAVKDKNGKILNFVSTQHNITERKLAEKKLLEYQAQLKTLASELFLTQQRERRRFAVGVHEHVGQNLALAKLTLESLRESASGDILASLDEVCAAIEQIIQGIHSLTFEISNPVLYELGFETAVKQWLTEKVQEKHGIKCKFTADDHLLQLDNQIGVVLFQAVRELLVNVVKHAKASTVEVRTQKAGDKVRVTVKDDGVGFSVSKLQSFLLESKTGGFGLFSIRERFAYLGGNVDIKSAPGQGTCVTLTAPLKYQNNALRARGLV